MSAAQLPLPFDPRPAYLEADFIEAASNAAARAWLARPAEWPELRFALWGPEGSGKSHLLHVWARRHGAEILRGGGLGAAVPAPPGRPLAIDDADAAPELALLHRLNVAAEAGQAVLLASRLPPGRWAVALPDLASRLRAITAAEIGPADDELLRLLLRRLLQHRQLAVGPALQEHLLRRLPRTPAVLRQAAALLDGAALAAGGPVTRRIADAAIAGLTGSAGAEDDDTMITAADASSSPGPIV